MSDQNDDNAAAQGAPPIASAATDPNASVVDNSAWQHPGTPLSDGTDDSSNIPKDVISPAGGFPNAAANKITPGGSDATPDMPDDPQIDEQVTKAADELVSATTGADGGDLAEIKQKALNELAPLVDQLDLPPADKFRTIMMLLQASDDQRLVEKAYEAAHAIEDEHARAQALLDIINEINYFTQPHQPAV